MLSLEIVDAVIVGGVFSFNVNILFVCETSIVLPLPSKIASLAGAMVSFSCPSAIPLYPTFNR